MIQKIEFRAMGVQILVVIDHPSSRVARELEKVPVWFETWEQSLSRFRGNSLLSIVNQSAGIPIQVNAEFAEVFEAAREAEQISQGLVTPVLYDALQLSGYSISFDLLPREQPAGNFAGPVRIPHLSEAIWEAPNRYLCLPPDMHLDFGGIAKGWAAQKAAAQLERHGPVLVSAGGDIAISGLQADGQAWPVGINDPFQPGEELDQLLLGKCGVATSGRDKRHWMQGRQSRHHIIDPRTGMPADTDVLTATIVAPTALAAETAAKTVFLLGSQEGMTWLESNPSLAGLLVLEDGQRLYSTQMQKYLWSYHEYAQK